jgi:hypothetical protein
MSVTVVRYTARPDRADENQSLVEGVFTELDATQPDGLRYLTLRLADGVGFVHVASIETADGSNPLGATAAFGEFQQAIADRCEQGPLVTEATLVGSYGFELVGATDA